VVLIGIPYPAARDTKVLLKKTYNDGQRHAYNAKQRTMGNVNTSQHRPLQPRQGQQQGMMRGHSQAGSLNTNDTQGGSNNAATPPQPEVSGLLVIMIKACGCWGTYLGCWSLAFANMMNKCSLSLQINPAARHFGPAMPEFYHRWSWQQFPTWCPILTCCELDANLRPVAPHLLGNVVKAVVCL
jgi:hypothetical protein